MDGIIVFVTKFGQDKDIVIEYYKLLKVLPKVSISYWTKKVITFAVEVLSILIYVHG
jgi:hypothetical protein